MVYTEALQDSSYKELTGPLLQLTPNIVPWGIILLLSGRPPRKVSFYVLAHSPRDSDKTLKTKSEKSCIKLIEVFFISRQGRPNVNNNQILKMGIFIF